MRTALDYYRIIDSNLSKSNDYYAKRRSVSNERKFVDIIATIDSKLNYFKNILATNKMKDVEARFDQEMFLVGRLFSELDRML